VANRKGDREDDLVAAAVDGDIAALDELLTRYRPKALDAACSLTDSLDDAEDLVQDAYIKAWQAIDTLGPPFAFWAWLKQIVLNTWLNKIGSATESPWLIHYYDPKNLNPAPTLLSLDALLEAGWDLAGPGDPFQALVDAEERDAGLARLDDLTCRERSCCEMVLAGHTTEEIAEALGISASRARAYIASARIKLAGY